MNWLTYRACNGLKIILLTTAPWHCKFCITRLNRESAWPLWHVTWTKASTALITIECRQRFKTGHPLHFRADRFHQILQRDHSCKGVLIALTHSIHLITMPSKVVWRVLMRGENGSHDNHSDAMQLLPFHPPPTPRKLGETVTPVCHGLGDWAPT